MILASWGGKQLEVSARTIEGISKLGYYIEAETEDKDKDKAGYKQFKLAKRSLDMDVVLRADLNVDVRAEIGAWMDLCAAGKTDKFYVAGEAISECSYLLVGAKADNVEIAPNGTWKSAELRLEFEQSTAGGSGSGSSSSSSKGSKKASVKSGSSGKSKAALPPGSTIIGSDTPKSTTGGLLANTTKQFQASALKTMATNLKKSAQLKVKEAMKAKGKPTGGGGISYKAIR